MNKCERNQIDAAIPMFLRQEMRSVGATPNIDRPGGRPRIPRTRTRRGRGEKSVVDQAAGIPPSRFPVKPSSPGFFVFVKPRRTSMLPAFCFRGGNDGSENADPVSYKLPHEMTREELIARVIELEIENEHLDGLSYRSPDDNRREY